MGIRFPPFDIRGWETRSQVEAEKQHADHPVVTRDLLLEDSVVARMLYESLKTGCGVLFT